MKNKSLLLILLIPICLCFTAMAVQAEEFSYVGSKNCKKCHIKEYKSWETTKMAQTFESLKPGVATEAKEAAGIDAAADYTTDPACLICHTTGYGKTGGFTSIEETPELAGVGCETCHGPGGTYTEDQYMSLKNKEYVKAEVVAVGMVDTVSEEQCVVCHKAEAPFPGADYTFDFEEKNAVEAPDGTHAKYPLKYEH